MKNLPEMQYRRCGNSGLLLPVISLGLWHNFGGVDSFDNAKAMIRACFDAGVTHFDLANNYGPPPGSAEENFGRILKEDLAGHRDEIIISTKAGYRMWPGPYGEWGSRKNLLASLDQSLKRMDIDYVDIFYSHRLDPNTPLEETMGALATAVQRGKALYVGISSSYGPKETKQASSLLNEWKIPCLIHQPSYSMFNRWVEDGLLKVLTDEGIGCIAFSPLAQGLLTNRYLNGIPEGSRATRKVFLKPEQITEQKLAQVRKLNAIAEERGQSLAQLALAWVLRQPAMTSVIMGASRVEQIHDNLATLKKLELEPGELAAINAILKG